MGFQGIRVGADPAKEFVEMKSECGAGVEFLSKSFLRRAAGKAKLRFFRELRGPQNSW
jgi:hypothetical protein